MRIMDQILVELDGRRRVSLGKVGRPEHTRYLVSEEADGSLVLTPAVVLSEMEANLLSNRTLIDRIESNRRNPERLVKRERSRTPIG
jgi:hypothetical protein